MKARCASCHLITQIERDHAVFGPRLIHNTNLHYDYVYLRFHSEIHERFPGDA